MGTTFEDSLPSELVSHVKAGCGQPGELWLAELPRTIDELERLWSISVQKPFPGIEYNFVAPATGADGETLVLKIAPPWETVEIFGEASYLRSRNGEGCVRLLAEETDSRAILIERIFPGRSLWEHFAGRESDAVAPAIEALKTVLRPVPQDPIHVAHVDGWFDKLRKFGETAFPADYARQALDMYDKLSRQPERIFYIHGDYHPGNIITHGESSFCVIDPKGWAGHIGYEIAVFLNNFHWWQESKPDIRERLDRAVEQFAGAFDLEPWELRQWAYVQMVIGSWWNFVDMPELYAGEVVKADIWDV